MNNWPYPERPGVPSDPDKNGAHVIADASGDLPTRGPWVLLWCGQEQLWTDLFGNREPPEAMARHRYVGPCLTPEEVSRLDDPERDATDFAHPAWWRGNDAGVDAVARMLLEQLNGKPMLGTVNHDKLQQVRSRIAAILTGDKVAVPRKLVESVIEDAEAFVNGCCCVDDEGNPHPALSRRYERDMQDIRALKAIINNEPS